MELMIIRMGRDWQTFLWLGQLHGQDTVCLVIPWKQVYAYVMELLSQWSHQELPLGHVLGNAIVTALTLQPKEGKITNILGDYQYWLLHVDIAKQWDLLPTTYSAQGNTLIHRLPDCKLMIYPNVQTMRDVCKTCFSRQESKVITETDRSLPEEVCDCLTQWEHTPWTWTLCQMAECYCKDFMNKQPSWPLDLPLEILAWDVYAQMAQRYYGWDKDDYRMIQSYTLSFKHQLQHLWYLPRDRYGHDIRIGDWVVLVYPLDLPPKGHGNKWLQIIALQWVPHVERGLEGGHMVTVALSSKQDYSLREFHTKFMAHKGTPKSIARYLEDSGERCTAMFWKG